MNRGTYGQIIMSSLESDIRQAVNETMEYAQNATKVDEHGSWDFDAKFDRKGRGHALNWDLYAYGFDVHSERFLIVIQIRQFVRARKNGFGQVRKNYFLVGTNEDGTCFAHPVESRVIHAAIKADKDVVLACQNWIFDGDYAKMIRHGDLALIPCSRRPAAPVAPRKKMVLEGSHQLSATAIRQNGHLYAKNPSLIHTPGTHPDVRGEGWYKIVVGNRADFWKFAAPTID